MTETASAWDTPSLEVRVYRDGTLVQREQVESDEQAAEVLRAWADVEGVRCEVEDLTRDTEPAGVLDPRPWEVDADDLTSPDLAYEDELEEE